MWAPRGQRGNNIGSAWQAHSARPSQSLRVGTRAIPSLIPIGRAGETLDMAVQKKELSTGTMGVGMCITLSGDGGDLAIVIQPDERPGIRCRGERCTITSRDSCTTIEAIVEEDATVAAALVGWAQPDRVG